MAGSCWILLFSDGLTDLVSVEAIENAIKMCECPTDVANFLQCLALKNGGNDNITLIVADIKADKRSFREKFIGKLKG